MKELTEGDAEMAERWDDPVTRRIFPILNLIDRAMNGYYWRLDERLSETGMRGGLTKQQEGYSADETEGGVE